MRQWRPGAAGYPRPWSTRRRQNNAVAGLVVAGCDYLTDEAAIIIGVRRVAADRTPPLWFEPPSLTVVPGLDERASSAGSS